MELKLTLLINPCTLPAHLLIVLNGIETLQVRYGLHLASCLLIVLNGIETNYVVRYYQEDRTFNRTKWN